MTTQGKWSTRFGPFYYFVGSAYYIWEWYFVLSAVSGVASFFRTLPVFIHYCAPTVCLFSLCAGIKYWRDQITFQLNGPNPSLRFEKLEVYYKEIDTLNCEAQRTASVVVVYPVDHYVHKFIWSGDGEAAAMILNGAQKAEIYELSNAMEKACRIYFERHLNIRETRSFSYKLFLSKARKPLKSFLGHALDTPTKELVMKAEFSATRRPAKGTKRVYITERSEIPLWEEQFDIKANETDITWEIKRPRNGYYYCITWS